MCWNKFYAQWGGILLQTLSWYLFSILTLYLFFNESKKMFSYRWNRKQNIRYSFYIDVKKKNLKNMKSINHNIDKCYLLSNDSFANKYRTKWANVLRNLKSSPTDRVSESLAEKEIWFWKKKTESSTEIKNVKLFSSSLRRCDYF